MSNTQQNARRKASQCGSIKGGNPPPDSPGAANPVAPETGIAVMTWLWRPEGANWETTVIAGNDAFVRIDAALEKVIVAQTWTNRQCLMKPTPNRIWMSEIGPIADLGQC
jgi:hypothetical protein